VTTQPFACGRVITVGCAPHQTVGRDLVTTSAVWFPATEVSIVTLAPMRRCRDPAYALRFAATN